MKDAKGSSPATIVTCGTPVPDLASEGNIDLVCNFDLPPEKVVAGVPDVKSVDYVAATTSGSQGFDFTGAAMLILGGATLLLALAVLVAALRRPAAMAGEGLLAAESEEPDAAPAVPASQEQLPAAADPSPPALPAAPAAKESLAAAAGRSRRKAATRPDDVDDEYNLPPLPR
jgi:hypothetical protein